MNRRGTLMSGLLNKWLDSGVLPPLAPLVRNAQEGSVMVLVSAGEFEMGDGRDQNCPQHRVYLDAYYIGVYAVTNRQYAEFIRQTGHRPPGNELWSGNDYADHPVVYVSWEDAAAYCKWAGGSLPTEGQWEKAARGPGGWIYPWGDDWDESKCRYNMNRGSETTSAVYGYAAGVSGYGTYQQSGNVWEWCSDWYDGRYYKKSGSSRNPTGPASGSLRVNRGGSWSTVLASCFCGAGRTGSVPGARHVDLGFRLVRPAL